MSGINAQQTRLLHRSTAVQGYLTKNSDTFASLSPFVSLVDDLGANNAIITSLIQAKQINGEGATGATEEKNILKAAIARDAGTICAFAADYALNIGDRILYRSVNYTTSDVMHLRDAGILGFVTAVVTLVTPLLSQPDFAVYPVTADALSQLTENAEYLQQQFG